jgi:hypothetical protein
MSDNFFQEGKEKYDAIQIPKDLELTLKRVLKEGKASPKSKPIIKALVGIVAALLVFVVIVNSSSNIAYALSNIPILNNLVQLATLDKGFNNLVNNDRIQQLNITSEDKGAKFTATTIVGDDLKLWISYNFQGEGLSVGQIKFKSMDDNTELPWSASISPENKNYIEVSTNKLIKDFNMEVQVYKDDPLFYKPIDDLDEEALKNIKTKYDQNNLTTLNIPISLNNKILKDNLVVLTELNNEFKSEIGTFKIKKLELSESRSIVYGELISNDYELLEIENPVLVDKNGIKYSYASNLSNFKNLPSNNNIRLDLKGGISDASMLNFKCSGIKYINKKDKHITIDLKNKIVQPNNLGVELVNIEGGKITLDSAKCFVKFDLNASDEKHKKVSLKTITTYSSSGKQQLEFKSLNYDKIILNVTEITNYITAGFDLKLRN